MEFQSQHPDLRARLDAQIVLLRFASRFQSVFSRLGFSIAEEEREAASLEADVRKILEAKLEALEELAGQLEQKLAPIVQEIQELARLLGLEETHTGDLSERESGLPNRLRLLDERLQQLRALAESRSAALLETQQELLKVWQELFGSSEQPEGDERKALVPRSADEGPGTAPGKLSQARLERARAQLAADEVLRAQLVSEVKRLAQEISALWDELALPPELCASRLDETVRRLCRGEGAGAGAGGLVRMARELATERTRLAEERARRAADLDAFLARIHTLYEELQVPEDEPARAALRVQLPRGRGGAQDEDWQPRRHLPLLNAEHARLLGLRRARLEALAEQRRAQIRALASELHLGGAQLERLEELLHEEASSEELLTRLDAEAARLRELLALMRPLLELIVRREWFKQEMARFERSASDSSRLRGDSRRLLQEEKFRKLVSKEFPALTAKLRAELEAWEARGGEPFYFEGESYLVTMAREAQQVATSVLLLTSRQPNFQLLHLRLLTSGTAMDTADPAGIALSVVHDTPSALHSASSPPQAKSPSRTSAAPSSGSTAAAGKSPKRPPASPAKSGPSAAAKTTATASARTSATSAPQPTTTAANTPSRPPAQKPTAASPARRSSVAVSSPAKAAATKVRASLPVK